MNAADVAKKLKAELKGKTTTADAQTAIDKVFLAESVDRSTDIPAIRAENHRLLTRPRTVAMGAATGAMAPTGACYYYAGSVLKCSSGVTESACAGTSGNAYWDEGEPCMLPVFDELVRQGLL